MLLLPSFQQYLKGQVTLGYAAQSPDGMEMFWNLYKQEYNLSTLQFTVTLVEHKVNTFTCGEIFFNKD